MRYLFCLLAILLLPGIAQAHNQPGPPYVTVDGVYADTNPFSANYPEDIPQDYLSHSFVVGRTIHFAVDPARLTQPAEFKWQWDSTDPEVSVEGMSADHTYTKAGAHVVILLSKSDQTGGEFTAYDTLLINVGTKPGYAPPKVKISTSTSKGLDGRITLNYRAAVTTDPSAQLASVIWRFGDGANAPASKGEHASHTYDPAVNTYYPVAIVKDSNDVTTFQGFQLDIDSQKAVARDYPGQPPSVARPEDSGTASAQAFVVGVISMVGIWLFIYAHRRAVQPDTKKRPS